jgi:O-antigen/teichoic acid export membrane protein
MVYGLSGVSLVTALLGLYVFGVRPKLPTSATLQSLWEFGRFSVISTTVSKVLFRVDIVLIGLFFTPALAGAYEVAIKLSVPAILVSTVAGNGLMARVSNFDSKGDTQSLVVDVNNTISVSSVFAVPMLFGAVALQGDIVVTLYGSEYSRGSVFLVWVMAYQLIRSFSSPMLRTLQGLDRPDLNLWIGLGVLTVNVALGVALLSVVGPVGVVLATVVSELLRYAVATYIVKRTVEGVAVLPRMVGEQVAAGTVMFVVVVLLNGSLPVRSWIDLVALVGAGAAVYGVSLLGISKGHRTMARNVAAQFRRAGAS